MDHFGGMERTEKRLMGLLPAKAVIHRAQNRSEGRLPWISGNRVGIPDERNGIAAASLAFHAFRAVFAAVVASFCQSGYSPTCLMVQAKN